MTKLHTCVTSHVDFQSAGFIILLATSWEGAGEQLLFSKVDSIMGK